MLYVQCRSIFLFYVKCLVILINCLTFKYCLVSNFILVYFIPYISHWCDYLYLFIFIFLGQAQVPKAQLTPLKPKSRKATRPLCLLHLHGRLDLLLCMHLGFLQLHGPYTTFPPFACWSCKTHSPCHAQTSRLFHHLCLVPSPFTLTPSLLLSPLIPLAEPKPPTITQTH